VLQNVPFSTQTDQASARAKSPVPQNLKEITDLNYESNKDKIKILSITL
jgi:hypothetical protein